MLTEADTQAHTDRIRNDGYTVIDFKTDRDLDDAGERYRRQVQIYAAAIASATGKPAKGVLLRV